MEERLRTIYCAQLTPFLYRHGFYRTFYRNNTGNYRLVLMQTETLLSLKQLSGHNTKMKSRLPLQPGLCTNGNFGVIDISGHREEVSGLEDH